MSEKSAPAMFAGVKPPPPREQPKAPDSTKPSTSTTKASGAPVGRFALGSAVPVLALFGAVLWATVGPAVALIVVGALVALGLLATFARSSARRRVATTTRVRPDGSITTTTKPVRKPGWNLRRRGSDQRTQRTQRDRSRSDSGSSGGGRSRWPSLHRGGSPGGRSGGSGSDRAGRPGSRSPRGSDRQDGSQRRLRDRMPGKSRRNRDAAPSPSGPGQPGSASSPTGRSKRNMPDKQAGRQQPGGGKWPWSRRRSRSDRPGTSGPTSRDSRARGGRGPHGGVPGDPLGRTKHSARQKNPSAAHQQGNRNDSTRPSKVPAWARRIARPASPPPDRDWTGGKARRLKDKVRDRWGNAWADRPRRTASESTQGEGGGPAESDTARRNWWPRRKATSATSSRAPRDRRWRRKRKPEPTDFKAKLDQRWEERGIRSGPKRGVDPDNPNDPTIRRWKERVQAERQRSSAESAAFAEDWTPAPQQHRASQQSAEAGLMAEGDWKPEPRRAAPRSASKGGSSQVSGSSGQDASTAGGRAAAATGAANAASRVSVAKENLANALAVKADRVSRHEGMAASAADLRSQAGRARQDSATMADEAGGLRQFAASVANLFRS